MQKNHCFGGGAKKKKLNVNNLRQIIVLRVIKKEEYHLHDTAISTKRCNYFSKN